jgi:Skp family chaperone for outer membrane proteins
MKTIITFVLSTFFAAGALAATESSSEVVCRAKAKDIAIQTYSSCVTEARQAKVEEIRTGYQKDLAALKSKYDKELKKLANRNTKKEALAVPVTAKELQVQAASKPVKGVAKQLPTKSASPTEVAPVQSVSEGNKVVAVGAESAESPADADFAKETAAHDGDQIDYIETPNE